MSILVRQDFIGLIHRTSTTQNNQESLNGYDCKRLKPGCGHPCPSASWQVTAQHYAQSATLVFELQIPFQATSKLDRKYLFGGACDGILCFAQPEHAAEPLTDAGMVIQFQCKETQTPSG